MSATSEPKPTSDSIPEPTSLPRAPRRATTASPKGWLVVAFALFVVAWGGNEFTPMLVFYRGEDVFGKVFVDSLLASYAVGIIAGLFTTGPLSDRYGRKIVMVPSLPVGLIGSVFIAAGEMNEPLIFAGRVISGFSIGMVMTAGSAWIKELSTDRPSAGARRSTMAMTGGFCIGAAVAGVMAQWGPAPGQAPYLLHIVLCLVALPGLLRVPETRQSAHLKVKGSFLADLRVPTALHPRFLTAVAPIAPWVFGSAGVAYAIMPSQVQDSVSAPVAFSALITAVSLSVGFIIQQFSDHYISPTSSRGQQFGLVLIIAGMLLATWAAHERAVPLALAVAVVLGAGYGVCLISGLGEVQRIAGPDDLGGLTAVFYSITYVGFFFPMILASLSEWFTYPIMLGFGVVMAVLALILVSVFSHRFVPEPRADIKLQPMDQG